MWVWEEERYLRWVKVSGLKINEPPSINTYVLGERCRFSFLSTQRCKRHVAELLPGTKCHCGLTQNRVICLKSKSHESWRERGEGTKLLKTNFFLSFGYFLAFLPHIYQSCPGASAHPHPQCVKNPILHGPDPYQCIFRKYFL